MSDNDLIRRGEVLGAYEQAVDDYNDGKTGKWFRAHFADAIAAIPAAHAPAVKVKPLVWDSPSKPQTGLICRAFGSHGLVYEIYGDGALFSAYGPQPRRLAGALASIEDAKAAAQADYEARILAAIEVTAESPTLAAALATARADALREAAIHLGDLAQKHSPSISETVKACGRAILALIPQEPKK